MDLELSTFGKMECSVMIDIPDHLRYRAPVPTINFSGVSSRYNSPTRAKPSSTQANLLETLRRASPLPPKNPAYAGVSSRFQSEILRPQTVPMVGPAPLAKHESVRFSREIAQARQKSNLQQRVTSKFFEVHTVQGPGATLSATPRAIQEEKKRQENKKVMKEGTAFKVAIGRNDNFDVMRKGNPKLTRQLQSPRKTNAKASVVMEWVNNGVAIPRDRAVSPPQRAQSPSARGIRPFYLPGGAGNGQFERSSTSPVRPIALTIERHVVGVANKMRSATLASPPRVAAEPNPRLMRARGKIEIEADNMQRMPRMLRDNLHPRPTTLLSRIASPSRTTSPVRGPSTACSSHFSRGTTTVSVAPADSPPPRIVEHTGRAEDQLSTVSASTDEGSPARGRTKQQRIPIVFPSEGPGLSPRRGRLERGVAIL